MKTGNVVQEKSFAFAVRIVNLYKYLLVEKKEYVLSKQVLRSGTSIGANIEEGLGGQSNKDFVSKLNIAYKETRETIYWIKLLLKTDFLLQEQTDSILQDADELCKIIAQSLLTMKNKIKNS